KFLVPLLVLRLDFRPAPLGFAGLLAALYFAEVGQQIDRPGRDVGQKVLPAPVTQRLFGQRGLVERPQGGSQPGASVTQIRQESGAGHGLTSASTETRSDPRFPAAKGSA